MFHNHHSKMESKTTIMTAKTDSDQQQHCLLESREKSGEEQGIHTVLPYVSRDCLSWEGKQLTTPRKKWEAS